MSDLRLSLVPNGTVIEHLPRAGHVPGALHMLSHLIIRTLWSGYYYLPMFYGWWSLWSLSVRRCDLRACEQWHFPASGGPGGSSAQSPLSQVSTRGASALRGNTARKDGSTALCVATKHEEGTCMSYFSRAFACTIWVHCLFKNSAAYSDGNPRRIFFGHF